MKMPLWVEMLLIVVGGIVIIFGGAYLGASWQAGQDQKWCDSLHAERIKYVKGRALCLDSEGRILN